MSYTDGIWVTNAQAPLEGVCNHERVRHRADTIYLLVMGGRIMAMQSGFAMLEAAFARPRDAANIMMKNMMDMFLGCVAFYLFGYEIAFGIRAVSLEEEGFDWALWFLQFSYATTAATIDSGALAGRVSFLAYMLLSVMLTGIIYPIVVRWSWGGGWLMDLGFHDFAGSAIVHVVGAASALVAICIGGPRIGRFPEYRRWGRLMRLICLERNPDAYYRGPTSAVEELVFQKIRDIHNPVQALFGVFLLLVGFLAFNPASTLATTDTADLLAARVTVITLFSAAGGAIATFASAAVRRRSMVVTIPEFATAVVAGMVASCAAADVVPPPLSLVLGFVGGLLSDLTARFLNLCQIDDPVGAVAAHGPPGIWGVIAVPLFARPHCQSDKVGIFFGGGKKAWDDLGIQLVGVSSIVLFTMVSSYAVVMALDLILGFRSNRSVELVGHDCIEHAYDDDSFDMKPHREIVMNHTPTRDCLKERVKRLHSPTKAYCEAPPDLAPTTNNSVNMREEMERLKGDVEMLTNLLRHRNVSNSIFGADIDEIEKDAHEHHRVMSKKHTGSSEMRASSESRPQAEAGVHGDAAADESLRAAQLAKETEALRGVLDGVKDRQEEAQEAPPGDDEFV